MVPVFCAGSATVIRLTARAEYRYVAASTSTASGAPIALTSSPPSAGPAVMASASVPSVRAWARCRNRSSTRRVRKAIPAASLTTAAAPHATTMASKAGRVSRCSHHSTGIAASSTACARSVATMTGRRRHRSTSAPTTTPPAR